MRYLFYFFTLIVLSCQSKNNALNNSEINDTTQTKNTIVDNSIPVQSDTSSSNRNVTNDTIFLGFRLGMTRPEFEKHKQLLLQKKKLKVSSNGLLYQVDVFLETIFPSSEHGEPKTIWTGNGVVVPEFYHDTLMSIAIKFLNTNGDNVYGFFLPKLDTKYYKSTPQLDNIFDIDKKTDTLALGNSLNAYVINTWSIEDINISLRFGYEIRKVTDKKVKRTDDVILKYWSEFYYNQKQEQNINLERKKIDDVQNDL